jgi:OPA family sugar phosphate sensor protein UhpC-like MFS transporter
MFQWFKSGEDKAPLNLEHDQKLSLFKRYQWGVIINLILGYSFFYTTRLSLSVAKKPLIDEGILTKDQLGLMGSGLFFVYAFGKFSNGFLADYANIRKFMSFGLLMSAIINITLGLSENAYLFIILWACNGWFQSMGSAPSCVSIFQWFEATRRGTVYSIWAGSHNIGEGITFVITSVVVSFFGWRAGFISPGVLSVIMVFFMYRYLKDRPATYGLPEPNDMYDLEHHEEPAKKVSLMEQLHVLQSPTVWVIALSCAMMYVSRYAINSWAILFLQEKKGYTLIEAGAAMGFYPVAGLIGAVVAGGMSDRLFRGHRPLTATVYGACNILGMALLFWGPNNSVNDATALTIFGFGIGGLIVFLAGLIAAELMPKSVVGAVKGFIGLFAYIGAAAQEYISSILIESKVIDGAKVYNFEKAIYFWFAAGILSMVLVLFVWNKRPLDFDDSQIEE